MITTITIQITEIPVIGKIVVPNGTKIKISPNGDIAIDTIPYVNTRAINNKVQEFVNNGAVDAICIVRTVDTEYTFYGKLEKHLYQFPDVESATRMLQRISE